MPVVTRTERFGFTLSPAERAGLRYLAEIEGLAEADVIRRLLRLSINELPDEIKQAIGWPTMPGQMAKTQSWAAAYQLS